MTAYLILLVAVLAFRLIELSFPDQLKGKLVLTGTSTFIFFLLALKKYTVGVDIDGYRRQYILCKSLPWNDFTFVYFERGYVILMKLFAKFGMSFQVFNVFVYAIAILAIYLFIKKYSQNTFISMVIFICYQFFVLYISGLRQMIAISICIFAYLVLDNEKWKKWVRIILSVLIVLLAASFHRSAYIFIVVILVYVINVKKINLALYGVLIVLSLVLRPYILNIIKTVFDRSYTDSSITFGGNFVFLMILAAIGIIAINQQNDKSPNTNSMQIKEQNRVFDLVFVNANMVVLLIYILFSGSALLRTVMYLTVFAIPGVPNIIKYYDRTIRILLTAGMCFLMLYLFFTDTLIPNQLGLRPYKFFWQ